MIHSKQRRLQIMQGVVDGFDVVQHMALSYKQVLPAVVVQVFHSNAPAGTAGGERAEAGFEALIGERASAIVVVEAVDFPGKLGNDDVGLAVVVVVLKDSAHAGKRLAIGGKRGAGFERALGKRAVAVVVEEELLHAVVGDENVREAAVATIAIKKVGSSRKFARRAVGLPSPTAGLAMSGVPFHVTGYKKI